ncbi:MAG: putative pyrimidine reductase [Naasia sp.]|nr:putative pyrimidine reductase [Naasia sp.]
MSSLTRLIPGPAETRHAGAADFRDWLADLYAPPSVPFVRLNFVASVNGSATGPDGTSGTLTGGLDRRILGVIRAAADVVVVGARTVREEGYLAPRSARLAIVTASGDLTGHRLAGAAAAPLVLCPPAAAERAEASLSGVPHELVILEGDRPDPRAIVTVLAARALASVVCEGGPTLAAAFIDAGVVDELCLTVAPTLHAPGLPLFPELAGSPALRLGQLLTDGDGYLYGRWSLA